MIDRITERFAEAYLRIAQVARYRPAAPSDGMGTILLTDDELHDPAVLRAEAYRYAERMHKQDTTAEFVVYGCTDFSRNRLVAYFLSAAELCFAGNDETSLRIIERLVTLAQNEIRESQRSKKCFSE